MITSSKTDCVILAGGFGKRISKFTKHKPKPLIKITKNSFLKDLLNNLCKYNLKNIYIIGRYKGNLIKKIFDNRQINFVKIKYLHEKKVMDTGGALFLVKKYIKNNFLVVNGDTFFDVNLNEFITKSENSKKLISIALIDKKIANSEKLNNLSLTNKGIVKFSKKSNYINGGIYFFKKNFLKKIKNIKFSLENNLLRNEILNNNVFGIKYKKFFLDIGSYESINNGKKILKNYLKRRAIFFDRDGVINYDNGYTYKYKNFKLRPGVLKTLKILTKEPSYIFIVTNQAGIAKGLYKKKDFIDLHIKLKTYFSKKNILIDHVIFCPHHPNAKIKKYKKKCKNRKPNNGMISYLLKNWNIDKFNSCMIGDQYSDYIAAKKSNLNFIKTNKNLFLDFVTNNLFKNSLY